MHMPNLGKCRLLIGNRCALWYSMIIVLVIGYVLHSKQTIVCGKHVYWNGGSCMCMCICICKLYKVYDDCRLIPDVRI